METIEMHDLGSFARRTRVAVLGLPLAATLALPLVAAAQTRPLPTATQTRPLGPVRGAVGPAAAVAPGAHHVRVNFGPRTRFGTIVSLQSNAFVMQTRAKGKLLTVDDTIPLQTGTYSFPLFVGKLVMVTGNIDATGIMRATTITRVPALAPQTPVDH